MAADVRLASVMQRIGPCNLKYPTSPEWFLITSIVSQLISTKAATTITKRLTDLLGEAPSEYIRNLSTKDETSLTGIGLTGAKIRTILEISKKIQGGFCLDVAKGPLALNWEKELLAVKGIGPWTIHMFRIFGLGDLDVLAQGDLGLRQGLALIDGLGRDYLPGELLKRCEAWRPWASIGTWYVWRSRGPVPGSE